MPIIIIVVFLNHRHAVEREGVTTPRSHHIRLVLVYISQMVPILGHHLDSVRIELVLWIRHQGHGIAPLVAVDVLAVVDACN